MKVEQKAIAEFHSQSSILCRSNIINKTKQKKILTTFESKQNVGC